MGHFHFTFTRLLRQLLLLLLGSWLLERLTRLLPALSELLLSGNTSLLTLSTYAACSAPLAAAATGIGISGHGDLFAGTVVGAFQSSRSVLLDLGTDLHAFLGDLAVKLSQLLLFGGNILALARRLGSTLATGTTGSAQVSSHRRWTVEACSRC